MTWQKTCDSFALHTKVRRAGPKAHNLWHMTAVESARRDSDGFIDPYLLRDSYYGLAWLTQRTGLAQAKTLVREGLWHDSTSIADCTRCSVTIEAGPENPGRTDDGRLADGWYYFHDASEYMLEKAGKRDGLARRAEKRRKDLTRRPEPMRIRKEVRERDRDMCRYCGVRCEFDTQKRRGAGVGTIEHVDPFDYASGPSKDGNSLSNCVVACNDCNGQKGQRTPEQWVEEDPETGRRLLDVPGKYRPTTTKPNQAQTKPETDPVSSPPSRDARLGSGSGLGLMRAGSGRGSLIGG